MEAAIWRMCLRVANASTAEAELIKFSEEFEAVTVLPTVASWFVAPPLAIEDWAEPLPSSSDIDQSSEQKSLSPMDEDQDASGDTDPDVPQDKGKGKERKVDEDEDEDEDRGESEMDELETPPPPSGRQSERKKGKKPDVPALTPAAPKGSSKRKRKTGKGGQKTKTATAAAATDKNKVTKPTPVHPRKTFDTVKSEHIFIIDKENPKDDKILFSETKGATV